MFLAIPAKLGLSTPLEQRIFTALLGTATVLLLGLLARQLAGDRAGLIAALVAAVYPALWVNDAMLGLETLYGFLVILSLLRVLPVLGDPTLGNAALLALCLSLATLTRSEGAMLFVFFALPTLILVPRAYRAPEARDVRRGRRGRARRRRCRGSVRNLTTFEKPALLGSGFGWVLLYSSCDEAFYGPSSSGTGATPARSRTTRPTPTRPSSTSMARRKAIDYIGDHKSRIPVVVAARVGRIWDVFRPFQNVELNDIERTARSTPRAGRSSSATGW